MLTRAKLDATGHRWLAELSNYNFSLTYRSGKKNADADGLSRLNETAAATSVFPDFLKAICNTVVIQRDTEPMVDSLAPPDIVSDIEKDGLDNVPANMISTTALTSQDWQKAQAADDNINFIVSAVLAGVKLTSVQVKEHKLDVGYLPDWNKYSLKDGILYKEENNDEEFSRLVLPEALRDLVFKSYHDDLGHQGRDRTASLIKRRFFWPFMKKFIREHVQMCGCCIRWKTAPVKAAHHVNIMSPA